LPGAQDAACQQDAVLRWDCSNFLSDLSVPRDLIRFGVYTVVNSFKMSVLTCSVELYQSWVGAKGDYSRSDC
jgi:hypothetical protein